MSYFFCKFYIQLPEEPKIFYFYIVAGFIAAPEHGNEFHLLCLVIIVGGIGFKIPVVSPGNPVFQNFKIGRGNKVVGQAAFGTFLNGNGGINRFGRC